MNGNEFDKLLSIQEKSIVAWDRAYNKIEKLDDSIERLTAVIEKKIDYDEKFSRWLKTMTALMGVVGGILTVTMIVVNLMR